MVLISASSVFGHLFGLNLRDEFVDERLVVQQLRLAHFAPLAPQVNVDRTPLAPARPTLVLIGIQNEK